MKRALQYFLLALYKLASATGVFKTALGRAILDWSYERYKELLEAGDIAVLATVVRQGTVVIDVGANIGFFTQRFASWVGETGKVIAIEPEDVNFERLHQMVLRRQIEAVVETVQAVAAESAGQLKLKLNPANPGDHRVAEEGTPVRAVCLDELVAERGWPTVSLVKIDVQGAEERVLRGALKLIEKSQPAFFIEIDDAILRVSGSSAESIFRLLTGLDYQIHRNQNRQISPVISIPQALSLCREGAYTDFLFLPKI